MKTITINSQAEFDALKDSGGDVCLTASLVFKCSIYTSGGNIYTSGGNIYTRGGNIYTRGGNIDTGGGNIYTGGGNIYTRGGYINTGIGQLVLLTGLLYTSCIYPPKCSKLQLDRVVPSSGVNDRKYWAERFGIDTSNGCYDKFSERLRVAIPRLKQKQNWSPLELLIIESHEGKYK